MITVDEAAEALKLSPFTVRKYARQNLLPAFKVGRDWCFESVPALIDALAIKNGNKLQHARLRGRLA